MIGLRWIAGRLTNNLNGFVDRDDSRIKISPSRLRSSEGIQVSRPRGGFRITASEYQCLIGFTHRIVVAGGKQPGKRIDGPRVFWRCFESFSQQELGLLMKR